MPDLLKWLARWIPHDPKGRAGLGPFDLEWWDPDAKWMWDIVKVYHDLWYEIGPKQDPPMPLSEIDWRIFKAWTIAAGLPESDMERCKRAKQICYYWPKMRSLDHYLYNRHG